MADWGLSATGGKRATEFASSDVFSNVMQIWIGGERKARETGEVLAAPRTLPLNINLGLGENNRSANGYLLRDISRQRLMPTSPSRKSAIVIWQAD